MATRLPSGSYRAQVLIGEKNGKRVYKSFTADTANAADLAALQYKAAHKGTSDVRSFAKAAEDFLAISSDTLSPTTLRGYGANLRTLKKRFRKFCSMPVSAIDRPALQLVINSLAADHSPKTVRNYHGFILSVLKANGIPAPSCILPKKKRPELNIPDEETLKRLFEAVKGTEWEVPVLLGALVPMREGEILGTDISDLDENNVLHIHHSRAVGVNGKVSIKAPKTDASDRYVQLPEKVADKIREQGYICNRDIHHFPRDFANMLKKAGIEHFRFHDLRHAFVSIAHAAGIPDAYIMARGGWSTNYTMNNVYRHVLDSNRKQMEETVNEKFSSLL